MLIEQLAAALQEISLAHQQISILALTFEAPNLFHIPFSIIS